MSLKLSREQCLSIKGVAIFLIFIHNFFTLALGVKCNESFYSYDNTTAFLDRVFSSSCIGVLFGFLGWLGVPMFFFISGYGLYIKYGTSQINNFSFIKDHVFKLWNLFIPVYAIYVLVDNLFFGHHHSVTHTIIPQITFSTNLLQYGNNGFYCDPGAYWFLGAILQFYFIFLVLRRFNLRQLTGSLLVFICIQYILQYMFDEDAIRWANHNFIGWGAPFTMGMILAKLPKINISKVTNIVLIITSAALLCLGLLTKVFSPFAQVTTVILSVCLVQYKNIKPIMSMGIISSSVFVIHPFTRLFIINLLDIENHLFWTSVLYIATTVIASWMYHKLIKLRAVSPMRLKHNK